MLCSKLIAFSTDRKFSGPLGEARYVPISTGKARDAAIGRTSTCRV